MLLLTSHLRRADNVKHADEEVVVRTVGSADVLANSPSRVELHTCLAAARPGGCLWLSQARRREPRPSFQQLRTGRRLPRRHAVLRRFDLRSLQGELSCHAAGLRLGNAWLSGLHQRQRV
jgi:hypothetical protein